MLSPLTNQLLLAAWRGVAWRSPSIISIPATDRARPLPRTPGARRHHLHAWAYVGGGIVRNDQLTMYGTIVGRLPPCFVHRPDGGGLFSGPRARRGRRPPTPGELAGPPPKVQYAICNCCVGIISGFRCPPPIRSIPGESVSLPPSFLAAVAWGVPIPRTQRAARHIREKWAAMGCVGCTRDG